MLYAVTRTRYSIVSKNATLDFFTEFCQERFKSDNVTLMVNKALVLMSGGLDSATCLYWSKDNFDEVQAISFNYFHRLSREKTATLRITSSAKVSLIEVNLPFIKENSKHSNFRAKTASQPSHSYIPLRNLIFYSISGYFAQTNKIQNIVGGHNASDVNIFRDASTSYFKKMNELMVQGLLGGIDCKIILPLYRMSRVDVICLATELNVPIELTWSCHSEGRLHCGHCYACRQRLSAFKFLGLTDPVVYFGAPRRDRAKTR